MSEPRRAAPRAGATDDTEATEPQRRATDRTHAHVKNTHRHTALSIKARPPGARPAAARRVGRASPPPPRALVRRGFYCAPLVMLLHTTRSLTQRSSVATAKCKTLQTHTHHTSPEMSRFLTALQLFLGALAVHAGTELLVLHVPRVPANRPPAAQFRAAVLAKACEHGRRTLSS